MSMFLLLIALPAVAQIRNVGDMNTEEIRALDRARTVVLLPGGVLEEHGPYLPAFTDGFMNEWWSRELAEAIAARPGWQVIVFPMLPLGHGGANEIGGKHVFPGSYGVRAETLRAVYMDLGVKLGEQGFRWIFILQNHGSPQHNQALDQAGDYFHDTFGGVMVNLTGLEPADADPAPKHAFGADNGNIDIHAGLSESSRALFLRPDLVSSGIRNAPSFPVMKPDELEKVGAAEGWPGYFGAPRHATAAYGVAVMKQRAANYIRAAMQILDGKDPATFPRYADIMIAMQKGIVDRVTLHDMERRRQQESWLKAKKIARD
jgi:creatinine amidohydrolase